MIARLNLGGAALSVLELAAGQVRGGHEVLVVAGRMAAGEESMEHVASTLRVPYCRFDRLQREVAPTDDLAAIRGLRTLLRERRPDVLHTHTSKAGATGRIAATLAGRARPRCVVHTYHGHVLSGYFDPRRERAYRALERLLAHRTDALVAVSEEVRDDLVRLRVAPREKFAVIQYGFDPETLVDASAGTRARMRAVLGVADDTFVVGWAGRLTAIKRPLDLVRAIAGLAAKGVDAQLVVVGDGELRAAAEALAMELDVALRCRFLGYRTDMRDWYAAFDVFLLSSANEGTPVVAIEALTAARPVVATRAGGTGTVVDDGETGFLAPVGAVDALADRLALLAGDADLRARMGELGRGRMADRFSTGRMVEQVDTLYRRFLQ